MDSVIIIKQLSSLLYPLGLVICAALAFWFFRTLRLVWLARLSFCTMLAIFLASSNPFFASWLTSQLEDQYPQKKIEDIPQHDVIIVLGGGLRIPSVPAQHTQLNAASDRYWYAVRLYQAGKAERIIVSGGNLVKQDNLEGEAYYAKQLLEEWGVPGDAISVEAASRTTLENKQAIAGIITRLNINSALLVTSALHMPRAYKLFQTLPIQITPASADVIIRDSLSIPVLHWIPSARALALTTSAVHEYYGTWYAGSN